LWRFDRWNEAPPNTTAAFNCSGTSVTSCKLMMDVPRAITATFVEQGLVLVSVSGTGTGKSKALPSPAHLGPRGQPAERWSIAGTPVTLTARVGAVVTDSAYKTAACNLAEQRIALAGARLAKILSEELK